MNIRAVPEPMLFGGVGDFVSGVFSPLTSLLSPRQGGVTVVEKTTAVSASVVGALAIGIVAIAILKKKKVI